MWVCNCYDIFHHQVYLIRRPFVLRVKLTPVYHTWRRLQTVPFHAECPTAKVTDALPTRALDHQFVQNQSYLLQLSALVSAESFFLLLLRHFTIICLAQRLYLNATRIRSYSQLFSQNQIRDDSEMSKIFRDCFKYHEFELNVMEKKI